MTPVLLVQGTWGWGRSSDLQWWEGASLFCRFLVNHGCTIIGGSRPFIWNSSLDGIGWLFKRPSKKHLNWESAGNALHNYLRPPLLSECRIDHYVPIAERNLIGHSHAMQVIAYACANGLRINRLLTIGSPVRKDMQETYRDARSNIASWLHVHSDGSDKMQWFGELFDGRLGIVREQPWADRNQLIGRVSHSKLLTDPACFPLWDTEGLIEFLRGPRDDKSALEPRRAGTPASVGSDGD